MYSRSSVNLPITNTIPMFHFWSFYGAPNSNFWRFCRFSMVFLILFSSWPWAKGKVPGGNNKKARWSRRCKLLAVCFLGFLGFFSVPVSAVAQISNRMSRSFEACNFGEAEEAEKLLLPHKSTCRRQHHVPCAMCNVQCATCNLQCCYFFGGCHRCLHNSLTHCCML